MATNFPSSLDTLTNPSAGDATTNPSHASQHANANDAIEALEAKVGVNGSAVTSSLDYQRGLIYITSASADGTVTAVNITNCFSAAYDNYRIELSNVRALNSNISFQMLSGSTPVTTNTYQWGFTGISTLGASTTASNNNQPNGLLCIGFSTSDTTGSASYDIMNPYLARRTVLLGNMMHLNSSLNGYDVRSGALVHENTISYDGIRILANAGNVTFVARVYGYKN